MSRAAIETTVPRPLIVLRTFLLITAAAALVYGIGLLVVPSLLADLQLGPVELVWARYLVPIYLGLALISWAAYREPKQSVGVTWGLVLF